MALKKKKKEREQKRERERERGKNGIYAKVYLSRYIKKKFRAAIHIWVVEITHGPTFFRCVVLISTAQLAQSTFHLNDFYSSFKF